MSACRLFAFMNSAACSTNHWKTGSPSLPSHSGCHCTPMMGLYSALSIASMTPSGAFATQRKRFPGSSTHWWWNELTAMSVLPYILYKVEPGCNATLCVFTGRSSSCECLMSEQQVPCSNPFLSLMSCATCPSNANASVCMPRHIPSMGTLRLYANCVMSSSAGSRTALTVPNFGDGSSPHHRGS